MAGQSVGDGLIDQIVAQLVGDERPAELEGDRKSPLPERLFERRPLLIKGPHVTRRQDETPARVAFGRQHGARARLLQHRNPHGIQHLAAACVGLVLCRTSLDQHREVPVRLGGRERDVEPAAGFAIVGQPAAGLLPGVGVAIDGTADEADLVRCGPRQCR